MLWNRKKFKLELIKKIEKLEISKDNVIVFQYNGILSKDAYLHLHETIIQNIKKFGYEVKVLILEKNISIHKILSKKELDDLLNGQKKENC